MKISKIDNTRTVAKYRYYSSSSDELSSVFFSKKINETENEYKERIHKQRIDVDDNLLNGISLYNCPECGEHLSIRGGKDEGKIYHFSHISNKENKCSQKTKPIPLSKILRSKKPEGHRHKSLKNYIHIFLLRNQYSKEQIYNPILEKREYDPEKKNYKIPDVKSNFTYKGNTYRIAFELQLSTTFATVIAQRELFYKKRNMFLLWIFSLPFKNDPNTEKEFLKSDLYSRFTSMDIFLRKYKNIFVINEESLRLSEEQNDLVLKSWYYTGRKWVSEYITLDKLTFEEETNIIYYKKPKTKSKLRQENVLNCIEKIKLSDKTNLDNTRKDYFKNKPYRNCRWKRGRTFEKIVERHKEVFNVTLVEDIKFLKNKLIFCEQDYIEKFEYYLDYIKINLDFKTNLYRYFNSCVYETDYEKYESDRLIKEQEIQKSKMSVFKLELDELLKQVDTMSISINEINLLLSINFQFCSKIRDFYNQASIKKYNLVASICFVKKYYSGNNLKNDLYILEVFKTLIDNDIFSLEIHQKEEVSLIDILFLKAVASNLILNEDSINEFVKILIDRNYPKYYSDQVKKDTDFKLLFKIRRCLKSNEAIQSINKLIDLYKMGQSKQHSNFSLFKETPRYYLTNK